MADEVNVTNLLRQYDFGRSDFNAQFVNLNFISRRCFLFQPHHTLLSRHSILAFVVSVMLYFVEIKYQGKTDSPFETHPKTMLVAVASVILYCFSYDANLRISSSTGRLSSDSYVCVVRISMAFFGPLFLASLSSVLFSERLCPSFFFSVSILFSLCELRCSKLFTLMWNWVQQVIRVMNLCPAALDQQGRQGGIRGGQLPVSMHLARLSLSEHNSELMEQVRILPV